MSNTTQKPATSCSFKVPFGYSKIFSKGERVFAKFGTLQEILGDFYSIYFRTRTISKDIIEVVVCRRGAPGGRYSEEVFSGPRRTESRMKGGQTIIIEAFSTEVVLGLRSAA